MSEISQILAVARSKKAADVHIVAGSPVLLRVAGELVPVTRETLAVAKARELTYALLTPEHIADFEANLDLDIMTSDADRNRYRVNVSYSDGSGGGGGSGDSDGLGDGNGDGSRMGMSSLTT